MYGCASLLHWVYVLEKVRMRAYLWYSILVYILGESMSRRFDFCESCEWSFFRISRSFPYSSLYPFLCDLSPCFDASWPSFTFLSFCFLIYLCFITPFRSTSSNFFFLILLDVCLRFSTHTLFLLNRYVHSYIITFLVGILRSATHDVLYAFHLMHEGMGIISLRFLSLVSFHFFHLKILAYVMSHILKPPWGHDFTLCLTVHTWAILEIGWRLFLWA